MATLEFIYEDPFPLGKDDTEYRSLTRDHVSVSRFDGQEILNIEPEALTLLANEALRDAEFLLRTKHKDEEFISKGIYKTQRICRSRRKLRFSDGRWPQLDGSNARPYCQ